MNRLDEYIDRLTKLPPAPKILVQLLTMLGEPDVDAEKVVKLITFDPVLTAKVLQRCNSASSGLSARIHDLHQAVLHVGFNEIYRIVASVVGETTLGQAQRGYGLAAGELWQHSVVSSVGARLLARSLGSEENAVFTAALLHDIGKLVLSGSLEDQYSVVVTATESSGQSLLEIEEILLGVQHASIGGRLLQRWSFPEELVMAVWHHHDPAKAGQHQRLAACVHIGDVAAHALGHGHGHQSHAVRVHGDALSILQLNAEDFERLVVETETALSKVNWFSRKEP